VGRPYATELTELAPTYQWALTADLGRLVASLRGVSSLPLMAIGSGGSLTVAEFCAGLHRDMCGCPAIAQTPLEAVASGTNLRNAAVVLTSAGGSNPDVLASLDRLARREPRSFVVVCLTPGAPLARKASRIPLVDLIELSPPTPRDGFLATNSLIALVTILERASSISASSGSEYGRKMRRGGSKPPVEAPPM
jgi:fructoselysine-6-P-deglycase FrlB-like protein